MARLELQTRQARHVRRRASHVRQKVRRAWDGGHELAIKIGDQTLKGTVKDDGQEKDPSNPYWPYVISKMGRVTLSKSGKLEASLKPESIKTDKTFGLTLVAIRLVPIDK